MHRRLNECGSKIDVGDSERVSEWVETLGGKMHLVADLIHTVFDPISDVLYLHYQALLLLTKGYAQWKYNRDTCEEAVCVIWRV